MTEWQAITVNSNSEYGTILLHEKWNAYFDDGIIPSTNKNGLNVVPFRRSTLLLLW